MSSKLRLLPVVLLICLVASLAWRLVKPDDPAIPSQLVEKPLPEFDLPAAVPGKLGLKASESADGQPRLLNLFASWCIPCAAEADVLGELRQRGVRIDGLAVRDSPEAVAAFLSRHGDPYRRIGADPTSRAQIALGSSGVPETFVVDGNGVIRYQYIGPLTRSNIPKILDQLEAAR